MTNRITVCHLKIDEDSTVNPETSEEEWPHGLTKEGYLQFLLNHNGSMMINVIEMLNTGTHPEEILGFVSYATEDEGFKSEILNVTKAGLNGEMKRFDSIDGQSPAAFDNENVVDFPGVKKETVH